MRFIILLLIAAVNPDLTKSSVKTECSTETERSPTRVVSTIQSGSGTVIGKDDKGFDVLSCYHVVQGDKLKIITHDNKVYHARVVKYDKERDLSLIRVDEKADVEAVEIATEETYKLGTEVTKAGFPGIDSVVVLDGTCTGYSRDAVNREIIYLVASPIVISGDSGGGLFRKKDKKLIGVIWGGKEDGLRATRIDDIWKLLK